MRVYVKHPGCAWKELHIRGELEDLQALVGGNIETVKVFPDTILLANEEGLIYDLPKQQFSGKVYAGSLVLVGVKGEEFTDAPKMSTQVLNVM